VASEETDMTKLSDIFDRLLVACLTVWIVVLTIRMAAYLWGA
jgi:hypothetical protein